MACRTLQSVCASPEIGWPPEALPDSRHRNSGGGRRKSVGAPELNTWVTLVPEQRGKRAQLAAATPALVSAVQVADGTCTVVYPCELVLAHGFTGVPLKRIVGVAFSRLRPATGTARLQELLMTAVRAAAASAVVSSALTADSTELSPDVGDDAVQVSADRSEHATDRVQECKSSTCASFLTASSPSHAVIEAGSASIVDSISLSPTKVSGAATSVLKRDIRDVDPTTPHSRGSVRRHSRSRSRECDRRSRRLTKVKDLRAFAMVTARAFGGKGQVPVSVLLTALEEDASLAEARSQKTWDAMSAIRSLEGANKVFIADDLVFSLA